MTTTADNKATVLLVMDIQEGMIKNLPDPKPLLGKIQEAIDKARTVNIEVIFLILSFRKGHPEISPRHKSFSRIKGTDLFTEDHEDTALYHSIIPKEGEHILHKKRISGFAGSDLDMVLKAKNVGHLVISGISTSGVVLSTVREGADKDYHITVLSDACADRVPETHDFLMKKIFPASSDVMTTDEWVSSLNN